MEGPPLDGLSVMPNLLRKCRCLARPARRGPPILDDSVFLNSAAFSADDLGSHLEFGFGGVTVGGRAFFASRNVELVCRNLLYR
jgi:hypothetical protein